MNLVHPAAARGWKTAVAESVHLGGTCINVGCIPSKTLISSARVMKTIQNAHKYGVIAEEPQADWPAMVDRKDKLVERIRSRSYKTVNRNDNIILYEGEASFTGPGIVEINGDSVTAEKIIIATGARAAVPPVQGLSDIDYLTSTTAMEMKQLPESLLILGGGIIALEFSQLFTRLGVDVTIMQRGDYLASPLEPEISEEIRRILEEEGVSVKTGTNISAIGREGSSVYVVDETDSGQKSYTAEQILVAAGRKPNSDRLNLEKTGVEVDERGYIIVDEDFKTGAEGIWAIGDVIGGMMFTHKAWHDAFLVSRFLLHGRPIDAKERLIPYAIFTEPEIAGVGPGEAAAVEAGYKVKVQRFPFAFQGRARAMEKLDGFVKMVVDKDSRKIIGTHIIGPNAGELIHELISAMRFGAATQDIQEMMHVHPTLSEAINNTAWSE